MLDVKRRCGCTLGVATMQAHQALQLHALTMGELGDTSSVLLLLRPLPRRVLVLGRAQTLTCASGACPPLAPPCQCFDTLPSGSPPGIENCAQLVALGPASSSQGCYGFAPQRNAVETQQP